MGVRGVTTFINSNKERFFRRHQLCNSYVVVDGNSLACRLYIWHTQSQDCFGGDYDAFARTVRTFFAGLRKCGVTAIVILDGSAESIKLRTIMSRNQNLVNIGHNLRPWSPGSRMFPLHSRQLFCDLLLELRVHAFRCTFEADNEIAYVARQLDCPVLSFDSDFFIFNVQYIPLDTFNGEPKLHVNDGCSEKFWYLDCMMFRMDHLLDSYPGLTAEHMPLLATLLGNDYVDIRVFDGFYKELKQVKHQGSAVQQRIKTIFKWLQHETVESAVTKVLNRIVKEKRRFVEDAITNFSAVYKCNRSKVLDFLNIEENVIPKTANLYDTVALENHRNSENHEIIGNLPNWFMHYHHCCVFYAYFLEICIGNAMILIPQIENYENITSHSICYPILSALYSILTSSTDRRLTVVARQRDARIASSELPLTTLNLPKLEDLPNLSFDKRIELLFDILHLKAQRHKILQAVEKAPPTWQFFLLAVIYWIKNASPSVQSHHVYSVLIGAFVLKEIDPKLGVQRDKGKLLRKYKDKIKQLEGAESQLRSDDSIKSIINRTPLAEFASVMSSLIPNFYVSDQMRSNKKMFDLRIVDAFAQLQTSLLYVQFSNTLLGELMPRSLISNFINGTFIYNMCTNLKKRKDIEEYLNILFTECPAFNKVVQLFYNIVSMQ